MASYVASFIHKHQCQCQKAVQHHWMQTSLGQMKERQKLKSCAVMDDTCFSQWTTLHCAIYGVAFPNMKELGMSIRVVHTQHNGLWRHHVIAWNVHHVALHVCSFDGARVFSTPYYSHWAFHIINEMPAVMHGIYSLYMLSLLLVLCANRSSQYENLKTYCRMAQNLDAL